jgi:FkbM family methyltransferase
LSSAAACVAQEIIDGQSYVFDNIDFKPGDAVIDIGGNIGIISIYLAKKYPFLKIYSFEPVKYNFDNFLRNIKLNNIPDGIIKVENRAVTKDARKVQINFDPFNTGASSIIKDISAKHV